MEERPLVGVGVMILKEGKVLLGKRKKFPGQGEWAFPGGHLEYMESFEECARRETSEESGVEIENVRFLFLGNALMWESHHFIQVSFVADWKSGEPQNLEPEKCEGWDWFSFDALPSPMMSVAKIAIDAYRQGFNYRDGIT
ncbi:NUDIX domain-containing protein [Candidatus Kaiserbacteria bacterium]|nr:NUDIX domain-containing protein [Candidatus Kaiserbacteria bacterium]